MAINDFEPHLALVDTKISPVISYQNFNIEEMEV